MGETIRIWGAEHFRRAPSTVIPAKAGFQGCKSSLVAPDPGFRHGDAKRTSATNHTCNRSSTGAQREHLGS
jgi:hypothetical protein